MAYPVSAYDADGPFKGNVVLVGHGVGLVIGSSAEEDIGEVIGTGLKWRGFG